MIYKDKFHFKIIKISNKHKIIRVSEKLYKNNNYL